MREIVTRPSFEHFVLPPEEPDEDRCVYKYQQRSSVVAVIADRTAYDIRYNGKQSNRFRIQVYERLVRTIRFAPKLYLLKREH